MSCCTHLLRFCLALLLATPIACSAAVGASVYLIADDEQAIHLSDQAHGPGSRLLVGGCVGAACADASPVPAPRSAARRADIVNLVQQAAHASSLDPALLHAVIAVESGYAVRALSPRGARGLMQLMPATARDYGVSDAYDARQNVLAGAQHLRRLLDQFDQDVALALAAYNAGAAAVNRHGRRVPPFAETIAYVPGAPPPPACSSHA
ncbi:MAG: lytic transglycosylase domain-containing protein [Deltaproteobacteria bacterium]|nr:lytic transglycosylase domain-containing protein [Nannocystaceae bacterium]